jgi:hypothetical protein
VQEAIPNRIGQRQVEIVLSGDERKFALDVEKVIDKGSFKGFYGQADTNLFGGQAVQLRIRCMRR